MNTVYEALNPGDWFQGVGVVDDPVMKLSHVVKIGHARGQRYNAVTTKGVLQWWEKKAAIVVLPTPTFTVTQERSTLRSVKKGVWLKVPGNPLPMIKFATPVCLIECNTGTSSLTYALGTMWEAVDPQASLWKFLDKAQQVLLVSAPQFTP
jgi:hypothetical protein